jgi:hypothetical protein
VGTFGVKTFVHAATAISLGVILWPLSANALEPLSVYEDWSGGFVRSDRWLGGQGFGGQEARREVGGSRLTMRFRHEGSTATNTGSIRSNLFLNAANSTAINQIEATFMVANLSVTNCAANNSPFMTVARPAQLDIARFNDGSGSSGDRTGDYFAGVQAIRDGSSTDPEGVLRVQGFINRCSNADCSSFTNVINQFLASTVSVGQNFTLRLIWDQPNHQFLFGLDNSSAVSMPYAASDATGAIVPFVELLVNHWTANCTAGAVVIDSTTPVGTVRTNTSAVIP